VNLRFSCARDCGLSAHAGFASNVSVASLQTARRSSPSGIFTAPETGSSPRKLGSLPNYFVAALQTALESRRLGILKALGSAGSARKPASPA
jgi:hypothetical protein